MSRRKQKSPSGGKYFLGPKKALTKKKSEKLDLNFSAHQEDSQENKKPTEAKVYTHISCKGFISRTYKEILPINNKFILMSKRSGQIL